MDHVLGELTESNTTDLGLNPPSIDIATDGTLDTGYITINNNPLVDNARNITGTSVYLGAGQKDDSAILQMDSTSKGMLLPRLSTAQINAIASPVKGLVVFDTNLNTIKTYNGSAWVVYSSSDIASVTNNMGVLYLNGSTVENDSNFTFNTSTNAMTLNGSIQLGSIAGPLATSACLQLDSTSRGMLISRMTGTQRSGITNPATGLMIFNTDVGSVEYYTGTSWVSISSSPLATALRGVTFMSGSGYMVNSSNLVFYNNTNILALLDGQLGIGTINPHACSSVQIDSTTKGFLPPRMTNAQMNSIGSPYDGLIIHSTDDHVPYCYCNTAWTPFIKPVYQGIVYATGNGTLTDIKGLGVRQKCTLSGDPTNGSYNYGFSAYPGDSTCNIRFTAINPLNLLCKFTWSAEVSVNNFTTALGFSVYKNATYNADNQLVGGTGSEMSSSKASINTNTAGSDTPYTIGGQWIDLVAQGDLYHLLVANNTNLTDVSVTNFSIVAHLMN